MRRFFFIAVLCALCGVVIGAPFQLLDEPPASNSRSHKAKPTNSLSKLAGKTFLPQLLARQEPLRYCIEGAPNARQYASFLEEAYTEWASAAARLIRQEKREGEFADLLPFLEKPFLFKLQRCSYNSEVEDRFHAGWEDGAWETKFASQPEQVRLILLPQEYLSYVCSSTDVGVAAACEAALKSGSYVVVMPLMEESDADSWWSSLLHEVGHTLGMGEGYALGATKNNPLFGTKANRPSIMQADIEGEAKELSCDDADALIVLADSLSVPGKPARTGETARTFKSLCAKDPIWYVDGRQQNRPPRASGDAGGFSETSYRADGKVSRFSQYTPSPKGFSSAFRLFEKRLSGRPSSESAGLAYYATSDGRTFVVEELEDPSIKRVFTLQGKNLLGETFLDFSTQDIVSSTTLLKLPKPNSRLVRVETLHRNTNPDYGTYFVYAILEGEVKDGVLSDTSAQMLYAYKDWLLVNLIEPGEEVGTTFLLEKDSNGRGQRMQVFQGNDEKDLAGGSFLLTLTEAKQEGALSERDKKYLKTFVSSTREGMRQSLTRAGKTYISQLGKEPVSGNLSLKKVSALAAQALDLHSKMGRALDNQFNGALIPADKRVNALPQFQRLFRPQPHVPTSKPVRRR